MTAGDLLPSQPSHFASSRFAYYVDQSQISNRRVFRGEEPFDCRIGHGCTLARSIHSVKMSTRAGFAALGRLGHDTAFSQTGDLGLGVAQLAEDLVSVLTEGRGGGTRPGFGLRHPKDRAD